MNEAYKYEWFAFFDNMTEYFARRQRCVHCVRERTLSVGEWVCIWDFDGDAR